MLLEDGFVFVRFILEHVLHASALFGGGGSMLGGSYGVLLTDVRSLMGERTAVDGICFRGCFFRVTKCHERAVSFLVILFLGWILRGWLARLVVLRWVVGRI